MSISYISTTDMQAYLTMLRIITFTTLILSGCSASPAKSQKEESLITNEQRTDVLFVPGMGMGWWASIMPQKSEAENYREWKEFNQLFKENGFNLKVAEIPAMASVDELSKALIKYIVKEFPADQGRKFHIVAKSMGGLAVRKALADTYRDSKINPAIKPISDQAITFTTISTPHQGSPIANMLMEEEACTPEGKILMFFSPLFSPLKKLFSHKKGFGFDAAGNDLRPDSDALKTLRAEDDSSMEGRAFSFGANLNCDATCRSEFHDRKKPFSEVLACWHDKLVTDGHGENDGLVPVKSATYDYSKYVETFDGDHIAISEDDPWYKGGPIWQKVFSRVLENIKEFEAASPQIRADSR